MRQKTSDDGRAANVDAPAGGRAASPEIRPAPDPTRDYGFLGLMVDTADFEGLIWTWYRGGGKFHARKAATTPPEPADGLIASGTVAVAMALRSTY
jgi:hypothetical protein